MPLLLATKHHPLCPSCPWPSTAFLWLVANPMCYKNTLASMSKYGHLALHAHARTCAHTHTHTHTHTPSSVSWLSKNVTGHNVVVRIVWFPFRQICRLIRSKSLTVDTLSSTTLPRATTLRGVDISPPTQNTHLLYLQCTPVHYS